jgi:catechol 2,3-dioxygenase-like lactoylglutathione lyase family enzyme
MVPKRVRRTRFRLVFRNPQINFYVTDVDASASFYQQLLGFKETFRTPREGAPIHVELRLGELTLGLASIESVRRIHAFDVGPGSPRAEVVLWTDDVDKTFARLTAKGVVPLSAPHDFIGTLRGAWVADPDGNPVQIVAKRPKK